MNLFSNFLKLFNTRGLSNPDKGPQTGSVGGTSTQAGSAVNDQRALKVSAVWASVQFIVNSVCSLPLGFYERSSDGRKELESHALNDIFHGRPNPWMKPRDFRKAMTAQMCLWSNAYAEIIWSEDKKRVIGLVPLRPGRMTPYIDANNNLTYHYTIEAGVKVYAKESIFHLKGFGFDGVVGLERLDYSREALGLAVAADEYAGSQFRNGGRSAGGYLMLDKILTPEQRQQMRELYAGMSETAQNKGKLWLLEGGIKYQADSINPDAMQMIESRKMSVSDIARFFGVPEVLLGVSGGGTGSWPASFEQQLLSFLTFTLQDYIDEWEHSIRHSLIWSGERKKIFADHDVTGFIKTDSQVKAAYLATLVQNGLMTRNEARKMLNLPKAEDGDELTVQTNLSPLEALNKLIGDNNVNQTTKPNSTVQPEVRQ